MPLDAMTAVFDRRSGQTHVVSAVVPEILAAMGDGPVDVETIAASLGLGAVDPALVERLEELCATGLVVQL